MLTVDTSKVFIVVHCVKLLARVHHNIKKWWSVAVCRKRSFFTLSCIPRPVTTSDGPVFTSAWVRWGLFRALCHWVCLISSRLGETNSRCRSMNWTVLKTVNYPRTSRTEKDGLYTIQALQRLLKSATTLRVFLCRLFFTLVQYAGKRWVTTVNMCALKLHL